MAVRTCSASEREQTPFEPCSFCVQRDQTPLINAGINETITEETKSAMKSSLAMIYFTIASISDHFNFSGSGQTEFASRIAIGAADGSGSFTRPIEMSERAFLCFVTIQFAYDA